MPMVGYEEAIRWIKDLPEDDMKYRVLKRMMYEKGLSDPAKPKYHKGRSINDWYTCGNCGSASIKITDNFCSNCGKRIM